MILFVFLYFYETNKISVLKEWAELVASQLTQFIYFCNLKLNVEENQWLKISVYLDFITP